jgi:hypothetical protein
LRFSYCSGCPKIGIGENIKEVQRIFRPVFNATDLKTDGSDFDRLFADGEWFKIGNLEVEVIHTPGHTPSLRASRSAHHCERQRAEGHPAFGQAHRHQPQASSRLAGKAGAVNNENPQDQEQTAIRRAA